MRSSLKKILILGGSSDIGINLVNSLDEKKYKIYLHYRKNKPKLKKKIFFLKRDFSKLSVKNSNKLLKNLKNFDIIVNLVGYIDNKTFLTTDYKNIIKSLNANFISQLLIYQNSIDYMKKNKFGRIINCSSIGIKFGGGFNTFNYSLSKYCSEFIPNEIRNLPKFNIFYNNLRLGVVNTKIHKKIKNKNLKERITKIPIKRFANIDEIITLIKYFIITNTYIASETINFTGGE
tara:strand:- start:480 stop:1178 length:699 start_codon:yes stop_codon:yes gene_type:complete